MSDDQDTDQGSPSPQRYFLLIDSSNVVIGSASSSADQSQAQNWQEVDQSTYQQAITGSWTYANGTLTAYTAPAIAPYAAVSVPEFISDRQFYQQLATQVNPSTGNTFITQAEALAAVQTGTIPSEIASLVSDLPAAEQFPANMMLSGATQFDRNNSLTSALGSSFGFTSAQLDAFWIAASAL